MRIVLVPFLLFWSASLLAAVENVILVTIDGLRWQEVFHGVDAALASNEDYSVQASVITDRFAASTPADSARLLMPFLHETVASEGSMLGNRAAGSCARVTNPWYFSYPGYNEILTGYADPGIDSNAPEPNPNRTFLEWLHNDVPGYAGRVAAFGSWNVFPYIINTARSGVPVNVGKPADPQTAADHLLADLHDQVPQLWETVRLDMLTHRAAMQQLQTQRPRALYIAYGETDDFAHDGHYDQYLFAAHRTDAFLSELWTFVQTTEGYRDNTILFVTTDHGRGSEPLETWQHHASKQAMEGYMQNLAEFEDGIVGSDAVWMAAIGPGIAHGATLDTASCAGSNQIAATLLQTLGLDDRAFSPQAGPAIQVLLDPNQP